MSTAASCRRQQNLEIILAFFSRWAPHLGLAYFEPGAPPSPLAGFDTEALPSVVAGFDRDEDDDAPFVFDSSVPLPRSWFRRR